MSDANKATAKRFYDAINAGRLEIFEEVLAEDFVEHEKFPGLEPTRAGARKMFEGMRAAFPDFRMTIDDMVAEDDKVFVRATMTGTHTGDFFGMAPTGRSMSVAFADFVRFEQGRVAEHWGVTDTATMMEQLGQTR